ncbi:MAG: RagB/SusD family nutrient uptake outer membrane protein [Calditrichia bacterium]
MIEYIRNFVILRRLNISKAATILLTCLTVLVFSCSEEFLDPANPVGSQVEESAEGLTGLAVGMQSRWSVGRQSPVYTIITGPGFTTDELRIINPGNQDENEMDLGGDEVTNANGIVSNMWQQALLTRAEAQIILDKAPEVVSNTGVRAGLIATASLYKALALGTLVQYFEQAPLMVEKNAAFFSRTDVLNEAVQTLVTGRNEAGNISADFLETTTGTIDIANSINALLARYYLMLGRYSDAISSADQVDLSVASTFAYDDVTPNPVAFVSILTNNVFQPVDLSLGLPAALQPDAADQRLGFYFEDLNPAMQDFRAAGFLDDNSDGIPLYLPGEMLLIKAEAYARSDDLTNAVSSLDAVIMKSPSADPFGIGAGFAAGYNGAQTQADILTEIYRQRCIELYMSGLRLEDSRRFNRPGPGEANAERNRNFYPYPASERVNNTSTPTDPSI